MARDQTGDGRVLYLGDDAEFVRTAVGTLDVQWTVVSVPDPDSAAGELSAGSWIAAVLSGEEGLAALSSLRESHPSLPCLFVTGRAEQIDGALEAGATDVLVRRPDGDDAALLARRLRNVVADSGGSESGSTVDTEEGASDRQTLTDRAEREQQMGLQRQAMNAAPVGITIAEAGGDQPLVYVNDQFESLTGYDESVVGENCRFLQGERTDPETVATMREAIEAGRQVSVEIRNYRADGSEFWNQVKIAPVENDEGEVTHFVGFQQDVTERRELVEKVEQIRENVSEVVWMSSPAKDSMEFVSDAYEEIWGRSTASLLDDPTSFVDGIHPDDRERVEAALETQREEPDDYAETYRVVRPDGEVRWVRDRASGVYENGELRRIVGVAHDITERKRREMELKLRNRAIEEAPIGITIHEATPPWPVTDANRGLEQLTGYQRADLERDGLSSLTGPDTDPERIEAVEAGFEAAETVSEVLLCYRTDGSPFWARVSISPVRDDAGEVTHFVGFLQDVTESKEHEQAVERRLNEFGEVLGQELQAPVQDARRALEAAAEGDEAAVEAAAVSVARVDSLIEDLLTVHSFTVKDRGVFESPTVEFEEDH